MLWRPCEFAHEEAPLATGCFISVEIRGRVCCCPSQTAHPAAKPERSRTAAWLAQPFPVIIDGAECTLLAAWMGKWATTRWVCRSMHTERAAKWQRSLHLNLQWIRKKKKKIHFNYANHMHIFFFTYKERKIGLCLIFLCNRHSVWNPWIINNIIMQIQLSRAM